MALTPGSRLGVYDVIAQIGAGGMGQVFRARDTTLNRDVALKVLPDSFAQDTDRLARFTREAQTLAALNHPNIAAIYGIEESPSAGSGQAGVRALVMELVEGEDLSQRLARGAIPLDEALPIAKQIAEALEAAHEQGIIHRDLKPANIKVRADGTVKVLDFGLAKALDPAAASSAEAMNAPTITPPAMTEAGMILGTAAYMSPEQARGRVVDRRADIWAFGCVLFEMLSGTRPFDGADTAEVLGAVVRLEPQWAALPQDVPSPVRTLLQRCLVKDPHHRVADISTARFVMETCASLPAAPGAAASPPRATGARGVWVTLAVAAAAIAALAVPATRYLRQAPPPETRLEIVTPPTAEPTSFALSPDGRQVVFAASGEGGSRLWLRALVTTSAKPLAGTGGATYPFWSPDGRSVGFFADGKLKRLDLDGGEPQTLATAVPRGGSWNADGDILFAPNTGSPLFRVPAAGGQTRAVTTLDQQASHRYPFFLADGRHFVFLAQGPPDTAGIYLGSLDSGQTSRLVAADAAGVYLPSGWLLWGRGGALVAQRLDLARQALTGEPVRLADSVFVDMSGGAGDGPASASASGLVAYRTGGAIRRQLVWLDRSGKSLGTLGAADESTGLQAPSVSPDGQRAVVHRAFQRNFDIWVMDGTRSSRFTFAEARDRFPIWSRDGQRIVFESNRAGHRDLYQKSSSGTGPEALLVQSQQDKIATDWSTDGRLILYQSTDPQSDRDIWVVPLGGDRTPQVFLKTPFSERQGAFSPDGQRVAYMSNESGRDEIYIRPLGAPAAPATADGANGQWQVSPAGGIHPRWRADGKELYYLRPDGVMMAAPIAALGAPPVPSPPVALFPTRISGGGADTQQGRQYDVAHDGRFLINTVLDEASAPITLLMNWRPGAKP